MIARPSVTAEMGRVKNGQTPVTDKEGLPQVHIQERSEHERKHQRAPHPL